jgi:uncharacterized OsmC-like protein
MTKGNGSRPKLRVTQDRGLRFIAEIRGHRIATDQPANGGGTDTAPMPLELMTASLGSCIALYIERFLAARRIASDGLRVEVDAEHAEHPKRIARFDVRIVLPENVPDSVLPLLERVATSCPAHHTLTQPPIVDIALVASAAAGLGHAESPHATGILLGT